MILMLVVEETVLRVWVMNLENVREDSLSQHGLWVERSVLIHVPYITIQERSFSFI